MNTPERLSLINCPEDICHSIFAFLSQTDLHAICLSHSAIRVVAEPLLYSNIKFGWQEKRHHPITSLLRTILRRPKLATHLRSVSLEGRAFYMPQYRGTAPKIPLSESELDEPLLFVAKRTNVPYREAWMEELRNGTMDAFIAVLISQATHLVHLFIGPDFFKESWLTGEAIRSIVFHPADHGLPSKLDQLQDVSLQRYTDGERNYKNIADVLPFFYLPSVKLISASVDNPVAFSWPTKFPPRSNVNSLELFHLREIFLGQILSAARSLQSFHWAWHYNDLFDDGQVHTSIVNLTQLITGLRHVQDTLVDLTISENCEIGIGPDFPSISIQGSLEALSDFRTLKKLTIPLVLLLGFSPDTTGRIEICLPVGLEHLTLTDGFCFPDEYEWKDHDIIKVLKVWLSSVRITTPKLQHFTVSFTEEEWSEPAEKELRNLCHGLGMSVDVIKAM
ncbi:hypothetical protein ACHAPJ_012531 [Fusarium lateritium]